MSGAVLFIEEDLKIKKLQVEFLVGSLNIVSLVGAAIAGRLSDAVGRKWTMAVAAVIFFLGAAVAGMAPSFAVLMLGRVITGIGVGFGLMIAPVYTAEVSPANTRGALVSLQEIFINFGILLGFISSYLLAGLPTDTGWRLMLGGGVIPALMLAGGILVMPESPRWLVTQNRLAEAEQVLIKTSSSRVEADMRLQEIIAAAGVATPNHCEEGIVEANGTVSLVSPDSSSTKSDRGKGVWRELLFPTPPVRRMLIAALGIQFFQQASGIDATVYYSPTVFKDAGISTKSGILGATVAVGFFKTAFILVATALLDRVGRRPLLMVSGTGMSLSLGVLAVGFVLLNVKSRPTGSELPVQLDGPGAGLGLPVVLAIVAICSFVSFFSIGFGPICWVLTSEIFPLRLRAQAMGLGTATNRVVSGTVALTFLSMADAMTPAGAFFFFAAVGASSVVFIYFCVPETKGKTLEEIEQGFSKEKDTERLLTVELTSDLKSSGPADDSTEESLEDTRSFGKVPGEEKTESLQQLVSKVKLIAARQAEARTTRNYSASVTFS